jgi:excisionase family DNA binding protein
VDVLSGPVVILSGDDCAVLSRQLVEAIRLAYVARGRPPPRHLLDFAEEVSRAARSSATSPTAALASAAAGTVRFRTSPDLPACDEPVWLTVTEAARVAEVSDGYMRRLARRGDVQASRGRRSAWLIDASSLAAWISRRRKEREGKAA